MGSWGYNSFENDAAIDFLALVQDEGVGLILTSLHAVDATAAGEFLELSLCQEAVAAAEIVAAMNGKGSEVLDPESQQYIVSELAPLLVSNMDAVKLQSRNVLARILKDSQLRDSWEDSDELAVWEKTIAELIGRLS